MQTMGSEVKTMKMFFVAVITFAIYFANMHWIANLVFDVDMASKIMLFLFFSKFVFVLIFGLVTYAFAYQWAMSFKSSKL